MKARQAGIAVMAFAGRGGPCARPIQAAVALGLGLVLSGCATDKRIVRLKTENESLMSVNREQQQRISALQTEQARLAGELNYFTLRSDALNREKSERLKESWQLRHGVRQFTDEVMKIVRENYKQTEISDYIGGELIPRRAADGEKERVLVDMLHPLPAGGTLTGGRVFVAGPARLQFCLLRPGRKAGELLVAAMSREFKAESPGRHHFQFDVPLAARKGDLIGVYCPEACAIPFDDVDTGNVVAARGRPRVNASLDVKPGAGRDKRAYSFGVLGFLDME